MKRLTAKVDEYQKLKQYITERFGKSVLVDFYSLINKG